MYLHYVHISHSLTLTERALPLGVKGVAEELWTKGNVGEIVLVLDRAEQVHSPSGAGGREGGVSEEDGGSYLELELRLSPLEAVKASSSYQNREQNRPTHAFLLCLVSTDVGITVISLPRQRAHAQ